MDARKLQDSVKALNNFMNDEGFLSEHSVKTIWERIMSCIAQGREDDIKLAFPIRMELQNKIMKELPSKLEVFQKNVQDLDDEMNKMLTSPDLTIVNEDKSNTDNNIRQTSAKSTKSGKREQVKSQSDTADAISIQDEIENKDNQIQILQDRVSQLEEKMNEKHERSKDTCDKMVETESNETDLEKEIENMRRKLKDKDDELTRHKEVIDKLQHKLSKVSSEALSDNEDLVDLGDLNSPVKVGERYSELYDNGWTDAFEVLTTDLNYDDKAAIQKLIEILYDSYDYCEGVAKQHLNGLVERLVYPCENQETEVEEIELDVVSFKTVTELRRSTGKYSVAQLQTTFIKHMEKSKPDVFTNETLSKINPYIWQCVELCWFMVIQTPPVYINTQWNTVPGEVFNSDLFKFYSETGDKMDYIVWPTLFRKKEGHMLCKGVAQPRGIL